MAHSSRSTQEFLIGKQTALPPSATTFTCDRNRLGLISNALAAGQLRPFLVDVVAPTPSLAVVYASNRYLTAKVRAFADFVAECFPFEGPWSEIVAQVEQDRPRAEQIKNSRRVDEAHAGSTT